MRVQGVSRIVDKMLRNNYNVGYAQIVLPRACVIHAVRHPLDVALSCFAQPFEGRGLPWASNLTGRSLCGTLTPLRVHIHVLHQQKIHPEHCRSHNPSVKMRSKQ